MSETAYQQCVLPSCGATYDVGEALFACRQCGSLLDVNYDWSRCRVPDSLSFFTERRAAAAYGTSGHGLTKNQSGTLNPDVSGVWRFRELLPFAPPEELVTIGEGQTMLQQADDLAIEIGVKPGNLYLQYEGFNPSGSFKDNGMAAAFTMGRRLGMRRVACASTGNTSASLAMFAGRTKTRRGEPMQALVFVGGDKIALGKLSQALDYGARTLQIDGDFDACMRLVQESAVRLGLYLMNSVNPFRLEGQKTIMYRILEGLGWEVPDWIVVPGGNLGNSSAFGKAFLELQALGLIDRMPRLAIINAVGANTLYELYNQHGVRFAGGAVKQATIDTFYRRMDEAGRHAHTVASAIEIGRPVNLIKALRSLEALDGVVRQVSDEAILDGKALVGRYGFGCEPASGASIAGLRLLLKEGIIAPSERVACILTGHGLKDPTVTVNYHCGTGRDESPRCCANPPVKVAADMDAVVAAIEGERGSNHA